MSKKYKKGNLVKKGIIHLANDIDIVIPEKSDTLELMVAVGVLVQMLALADAEKNEINKDKYKKMMCDYVDKIYDEVIINDSKN